MAQRLVAQAPRRVIDWLEATGAGNSPRLIERVIEWAEARERR